MFLVLDTWPSVPVAYSPIRPKSQVFNIGHNYALWIRNFMVMMKKPENLDRKIYDWKLGEKCSKKSQLPIIETPEQNKIFDFQRNHSAMS
jgi:hypothetical protein